MEKKYTKTIIVTFLLALISQLGNAQISETTSNPTDWTFFDPTLPDVTSVRSKVSSFGTVVFYTGYNLFSSDGVAYVQIFDANHTSLSKHSLSENYEFPYGGVSKTVGAETEVYFVLNEEQRLAFNSNGIKIYISNTDYTLSTSGGGQIIKNTDSNCEGDCNERVFTPRNIPKVTFYPIDSTTSNRGAICFGTECSENIVLSNSNIIASSSSDCDDCPRVDIEIDTPIYVPIYTLPPPIPDTPEQKERKEQAARIEDINARYEKHKENILIDTKATLNAITDNQNLMSNAPELTVFSDMLIDYLERTDANGWGTTSHYLSSFGSLDIPKIIYFIDAVDDVIGKPEYLIGFSDYKSDMLSLIASLDRVGTRGIGGLNNISKLDPTFFKTDNYYGKYNNYNRNELFLIIKDDLDSNLYDLGGDIRNNSSFGLLRSMQSGLLGGYLGLNYPLTNLLRIGTDLRKNILGATNNNLIDNRLNVKFMGKLIELILTTNINLNNTDFENASYTFPRSDNFTTQIFKYYNYQRNLDITNGKSEISTINRVLFEVKNLKWKQISDAEEINNSLFDRFLETGGNLKQVYETLAQGEDLGCFIARSNLASDFINDFGRQVSFSSSNILSDESLLGMELGFASSSNIPYPITIRSFAPFEYFGGGFHGDGANRNYTLDPNATARVHQRIEFDTDSTTLQTNAWSSPTFHSLYPDFQMTETPAIEIGDFNIIENGTSKTFNFDTHYAGANPLTPGAPSIDVFSDFSITENKANGTLKIEGSLTGDNFPSTEAFITDPSGQELFIGIGIYEGSPFTSLWGSNSDNPITDYEFVINTNSTGNFESITANGETYSIAEWNNLFEDTNPHSCAE